MTRVKGAVALIVLGLAPLDACGPPPPPQRAALAIVDGKPTAVVAACGMTSVEVTVFDDTDPRPTPPPSAVPTGGPKTLHYDWSVVVALPTSSDEVEVELLGAPRTEWTIQKSNYTVGDDQYGFWVVPLTKFETGHRYAMGVPAHDGPTSANYVKFTTNDFHQLAPDQVLAVVDGANAVMTRTAFIDKMC